MRESTQKATQDLDVMRIQWLDKPLGGMMLAEVNRHVLDRVTQTQLADAASNSLVNRLPQCLRVILRRAVNDWEWLDRAPSIRFLREPTHLASYVDRVSGRQALRLVGGKAVTIGYDSATVEAK